MIQFLIGLGVGILIGAFGIIGLLFIYSKQQQQKNIKLMKGVRK